MTDVPSVWITRPQPGNQRTSEYLVSAGVPVISVPVLEVETVLPADFDPEPRPDWILFVSRNAVVGMDHFCLTLPRVSRDAVRTAAVGRRTAEEVSSRGWNVTVIPETETAEGLLRSMSAKDMTGRRVWIPSGNREGSASSTLPEGLRALGADVRVIPVYETRNVIPEAEDLRRLDAARPGAVVLHSPSSGEAVFSDRAPAAFRPWKEAVMICIGPATSSRMRELGAKRCRECKEPSDEAVLEALFSLEDLGLERKIP